MKQERKKIRAMTAISLILSISLLLAWLGCMGIFVYATAQDYHGRFLAQNYDFIGYDALREKLYEDLESDPADRFSAMAYTLTEAVADYNRAYFSPTVVQVGETPVTFWDPIYFPAAVVIYDTQGNILLESGDYLYFSYATQEQFTQQIHPGYTDQNAFISLSQEDSYKGLYALYEEDPYMWDVVAMRITGYRDGSRIDPQKIEYVNYDALDAACNKVNKLPNYAAIQKEVSYLNDLGVLEWTTLTERAITRSEEPEVFYTLRPGMTVYDAQPTTYRGQTYESLLELTKALHFEDWPAGRAQTHMAQAQEYGLDQTIVFDGWQFKDYSAFDIDSQTVVEPDTEFIMISAAAYQPIVSAIGNLRWVLIVTGALMLSVLALALGLIRKFLIKPLNAVNEGIRDNWNPYLASTDPMWREMEELTAAFRQEAEASRRSKDEITRLKTALSYARRAEQNRRQMTSNIAHELKTPLAIIHSYAEGLQENIAEEKREQYLETILSETERMDGMVMEMLDLSRLEAGKVTLTRTDFSLSALVSETYEKFAPMAQEKNLQVTLELENDCPITADEARIEQVIRNFLSNAVRYTPEGGTVRIKTETRYYAKGNKVSFSVENTAKHFTDRELIKIWETFYRTDKARSGKGTGLGLAICKNILNLHGGKCTVKNTDLGVEFSFTL